MHLILAILAAQATAAAAEPAAQPQAVAPAERRTAPCLPVQAVVPPFNNTPEAMDQARVAAGYVLAAERRHAPAAEDGKSAREVPLCGSDWVEDSAEVVTRPAADPEPAEPAADGET